MVDNQPSRAFSSFQSRGLAAAAWQGEVLRAFQQWANSAAVNVAVVPDSGDPLGTPGFSQGDELVGDIRVAARPLSSNVLAIAAPPGVYGDTRAGDIVINSDALLNVGGKSGGSDLFTAMLQEAGHALSIGNSYNPSSAMDGTYQGVRAGLSAADSVYVGNVCGPRRDDFDADKSDGTLKHASEIKLVKTKDGSAPNFTARATSITTASARRSRTRRSSSPASSRCTAPRSRAWHRP